MKNFKEAVQTAVFIAVVVFLVGVAIAVFSGRPWFGIFFVSATAVGYAIYASYGVFALVMGVFGLQKALRTEPKVPPVL